MVEASRNHQTIIMSYDKNLSGRIEIEHTFDVVMHMKKRYPDNPSKTGVSCIKNRYGSVDLATFFNMTTEGLVRP